MDILFINGSPNPNGNTAALAQGHTQIAHRQAESKAADTPKGAKENGHPDVNRIFGREKVEQRGALRHGQQGSQQGEYEPGKNALYHPVRLPAPLFDAVNGYIAARLAECTHSNNQ